MACEAKVSNTSPAKCFLLSIGKSKSALWSSNLTQKGVLLFLWDNVCVWVHVCVCVYLCVCMLHMCVRAHICMHTCVCAYKHSYMCVHKCMYIFCVFILWSSLLLSLWDHFLVFPLCCSFFLSLFLFIVINSKSLSTLQYNKW